MGRTRFLLNNQNNHLVLEFIHEQSSFENVIFGLHCLRYVCIINVDEKYTNKMDVHLLFRKL